MRVLGAGIYVLLTSPPLACAPRTHQRITNLLRIYEFVYSYWIRLFVDSVRSTHPYDLHALSTPPAFILSQDQTLKKNRIGATLKIQLLNFQGSFPSAKIRKRLPDSSISFFFSLISLTNALFLLFHLLFSHIFVSSIFILPFQKPLSRGLLDHFKLC